MFKVIIVLSLITILSVQFSTENAIPIDVDKKLTLMRNEIKFYRWSITKIINDLLEDDNTQFKKDMKRIYTSALHNVDAYFNKTEDEARISGLPDNVLVAYVCHNLVYEEMEKSNFFQLVKDEFKSLYNEKTGHEIMFEFIDKSVDTFREGFQAIVKEMKTNPIQIFKERTEEEIDKERKTKYNALKQIYIDKITKYKDETSEKLKKIGKESELQTLVDYLENF